MSIDLLPAGSSPSSRIYPLVQATMFTSMPHTVYEVFGSSPYEIDDDVGKTRTFYAVVSAPAGFNVEVRITDLTAGGVELLALSSASVAPAVVSGVFLVADATLRVYSVEVRVTGGVPVAADRGYCYGSYIEVT